MVYSSPEPVTGLGFRLPRTTASSRNDTRSTSLFIVTTGKVLTYVTVGKGAGTAPLLIDDLGTGVGCSEITPDGTLIVATDAALYLYGPEGREACLAYDGPKARVDGWGHYLVISGPARLIVFDLENRLVAHATSFKSPVSQVWAEWDQLFILTEAGEV